MELLEAWKLLNSGEALSTSGIPDYLLEPRSSFFIKVDADDVQAIYDKVLEILKSTFTESECAFSEMTPVETEGSSI